MSIGFKSLASNRFCKRDVESLLLTFGADDDTDSDSSCTPLSKPLAHAENVKNRLVFVLRHAVYVTTRLVLVLRPVEGSFILSIILDLFHRLTFRRSGGKDALEV